jgi:hypothetical protein
LCTKHKGEPFEFLEVPLKELKIVYLSYYKISLDQPPSREHDINHENVGPVPEI